MSINSQDNEFLFATDMASFIFHCHGAHITTRWPINHRPTLITPSMQQLTRTQLSACRRISEYKSRVPHSNCEQFCSLLKEIEVEYLEKFVSKFKRFAHDFTEVLIFIISFSCIVCSCGVEFQKYGNDNSFQLIVSKIYEFVKELTKARKVKNMIAKAIKSGRFNQIEDETDDEYEDSEEIVLETVSDFVRNLNRKPKAKYESKIEQDTQFEHTTELEPDSGNETRNKHESDSGTEHMTECEADSELMEHKTESEYWARHGSEYRTEHETESERRTELKTDFEYETEREYEQMSE